MWRGQLHNCTTCRLDAACNCNSLARQAYSKRTYNAEGHAAPTGEDELGRSSQRKRPIQTDTCTELLPAGLLGWIRGRQLTNSDLVAGVAPGCCSIHEVAIAGAALQVDLSQVITLSQGGGICAAYAVLTSACPALLGCMPSKCKGVKTQAHLCVVIEGGVHIGCRPWHQRSTCSKQMHSQEGSMVGMA